MDLIKSVGKFDQENGINLILAMYGVNLEPDVVSF